MTRRSKRSIEGRLDALDERHRDPEGWRALLDLPADATRADGWRAFLRGDGDDEAWRAYQAGDGDR
jgi:hypothetical protein